MAPERRRPLIVTAIFTGLRASEIGGLTWDDVDLEDRLIRVRQRADRWNEIGPPKSATSRSAFAPGRCRDALDTSSRGS